MRTLSLLVVAVFALGACVATPTVAPGEAPSGAFTLDNKHASIIWRVQHGEGLSWFTGRFDAFDAALDFDAENPQAARLDVSIDATSINTGLDDFNVELANAGNVLGGETNPEIRFTSTGIEITGENTGLVTGDLTLRGVTKPMTLDVTFNGGSFDLLRGTDVIGFSARGEIDRREWGADAWVRFGVGTQVQLIIEAEFLRTPTT